MLHNSHYPPRNSNPAPPNSQPQTSAFSILVRIHYRLVIVPSSLSHDP
jgi:hypothetical protein